MKFTLTKEQDEKVKSWLHETVYPHVIAEQKAYYESNPQDRPSPVAQDCWDAGYPYTGASGGGLTYEFTPTSLGTVEEVSYSGYPEKLNVTDYDNW